MIALLNGTLKNKYDGIAIIECGGVGYEVSLTSAAYYNLPNINEKVEVYTYMSVKEDGISLFGFDSYEEKRMFLQLITVSGIGSKSAIQILSSANLVSLVSAIANEDLSVLSTVKGIGKKTAERIILELKDKIDPYEFIGFDKSLDKSNCNMTALNDAIATLSALGMTKNEAQSLAQSVVESGDSAENIVAKAFKNMR